MNTFNDLHFKPAILEVIKFLKFNNPTKCQSEFIPQWRKHSKNILCQAWTGTGKTHAFLLPIVNDINTDQNETQAIIIVPTKELGSQIKNNLQIFKNFIPDLSLGSTLTSNDTAKIINQSQKRPHILVGTPDRLYQLLKQGKAFFTTAKSLIIDECDMIFNKDFAEILHELLTKFQKSIQIGIFSATINQSIREWILKYIPNITFMNIYKNQISNSNINHILINTNHKDRLLCLESLLKFINPYFCLIFVNNKADITQVYNITKKNNKNTALLHGDLPPRSRLRILKEIQNLKYQYVVVSDVASRGLDIEGASHVISLNLPNNLEFYIHRSGRCGRKNYEGISYVFYEVEDLWKINKLKHQGLKFNLWKLTTDKFYEIKTQRTRVYNHN